MSERSDISWLEKAREEAKLMGYCIKSLKQELLHTKKELQEVKGREVKLLKKDRDGPPEINEQDLNFIANATNKELQHKRYM
ncbi:WEB family protein [Senna tora]|uniref:WEB family protein n=1 Tax=Senna tora TaxID=362788 RepID=A0A834SVL0_9FABA|nr:WEB family protein [Senna tora]